MQNSGPPTQATVRGFAATTAPGRSWVDQGLRGTGTGIQHAFGFRDSRLPRPSRAELRDADSPRFTVWTMPMLDSTDRKGASR